MSLKNPFPRPDEPAPPRPVGRSEEETRVSPSDLLRALWDARWLLLVGSLGLAFVTLVVSSFLPKTYEARAKLLVMPPPFKTEMHPPLLSVETYRELADSTTIKTRVVEQLSDKGLTRNGSLNGMKTSLSASSIPGQPFSPLVELIVEASSAELAQAAVTLWGEIFVRENSNISSEGKVESVEFIQSQYPLITNALGQTERKLKETQDTYEQNDVGFNNTWDQRLANDALETQRLLADRKLETERLLLEFNLETNQKFLKFTEETADLLKDYQLETQRLLAELSQELDIDALQKLLDAKQAQFNEYQVKLGDLRLSLKTTEHRLKTLRTEVEAQPQFLVISKAITDDALFNKTDKDGKISEELARLKLQSQEINPVYQTLINELVTTKITYGSLIPQREHLTSEITTIKKETEDLRKDLDNRKLRYATLERARDVGLKNLTASREKGLDALKLTTANELEILKVNRAYGLAQLESARKLGAEELARHRKLLTDELLREKTLAVSSLQREVENKQGTYKLLAQKAEAAQLAKTEQSKDVKLVAAAVKPTSPTKPRPFLNAALAFVFGGVSSCLFVLGRYMLMIS